MIERQAGRLFVTAPLIMDNARSLLEAGRAALQAGRANY
jgi:phospholipid transport system transporter-binding protein